MTRKGMPASGDPVIDQGHDDLNALIDEISRLCVAGEDCLSIEKVVRRFRMVAAEHFQQEMAILDQAGAATDQHRRAHMDILVDIDDCLTEASRHHGKSRWFELLDTLERMLFEHEILEDSRYYALLGAER